MLPVYEELLERLALAGAAAVQVDEPCLVGDLAEDELVALEASWRRLTAAAPALPLTLAT